MVKCRRQWLLKFSLAEGIFMSRFFYQPLPREEVYSGFLEYFLLAGEKAAINTIFSSVNQVNVEIMPRHFAQISPPALTISGEKDKTMPASVAKEIVALNRENIVYHRIPNT